MTLPAEVEAARRALGIPSGDPLGSGGEAVVYAIDRERVARIHRPGGPPEQIHARTRLLDEIAPQAAGLPFQVPSVLETREVAGCIVCIEPRLPGEAVATALASLGRSPRDKLVRAYLDAANTIGVLDVDHPDCRDLCRLDRICEPTPQKWARARAVASLAAAGPDFARVDGTALADALPDPKPPALLHLDVFPGNMLCEGETITAVIDFGTFSARADPQLDPLLAAVYLQEPMTPIATPADHAVAKDWLEERGLGAHYAAAQHWAAAFWSPFADDAGLHAWCRRTLLA